MNGGIFGHSYRMRTDNVFFQRERRRGDLFRPRAERLKGMTKYRKVFFLGGEKAPNPKSFNLTIGIFTHHRKVICPQRTKSAIESYLNFLQITPSHPAISVVVNPYMVNSHCESLSQGQKSYLATKTTGSKCIERKEVETKSR